MTDRQSKTPKAARPAKGVNIARVGGMSMSPDMQNPAMQGGASRVLLPGVSHSFLSLDAYQAQFLALAHAVRPELVAMLAALAFGGVA
jgi:hypothetical protein